MSKRIDMNGQKFGRLTVIAEGGRNKTGNSMWVCRCDCGNITPPIRGVYLRSGHTTSCGCLKTDTTIARCKTHGMSRTRLHRIWLGMRSRCKYPSNQNYSDYGGRGITVCNDWLNDFKAFHDWSVANGYREDLSIDRIDVNGNYEPFNCRWASNEEQAVNRRDNTMVEIDGETHSITQWARLSGIKQQTISYRYKKGIRGVDLIKLPQEGRCRK